MNGISIIDALVILTILLPAIVLMIAILIRNARLRRSTDRLESQIKGLREDLTQQMLFMRMLAHELRTPLAIIDSHRQLLARLHHADPDSDIEPDPETSAHLGEIRSGVERISSLIDRFIGQDQFTKIDRIERLPINLAALIADAVAEVQRQTDDHLIRTLIEGENRPILGDPALLRVLLLNLLENAVRYSPEGGAIEVRVRTDEHRVTIEVTDEGVGIPVAAQEKIFERYYRTAQVEDAVGTGLGLYIVRSIARLHGGDVLCESTVGEGSTFRVRLKA